MLDMSKLPPRGIARTIAERLESRRLLSDVIAVGQEFRVNTVTPGRQDSPAVAMGSDGNFIVVWDVNNGAGDQRIRGQRFDAAGVAQGQEIVVTTDSTRNKSLPSVAIDADGDFVCTWTSDGQDGSGYGVYARQFSTNGVPVGDEFRVNTYTTGSQSQPSGSLSGARVAADADGDFVITWSGQGLDDASGIFAQRYDSTGNAVGNEFRVNTYTTDVQNYPAVAVQPGGDFIITWTSLGQDGDGNGVYAQRYSFSGAPLGAEFRVNATPTGTQGVPNVAFDSNGNLLVMWVSSNPASFYFYGQRFDPSGTPLGGEFFFDPQTGSVLPWGLGMSASGDFVVTWDRGFSDAEVYARRFDASGTPQGAEFRVNSTTISAQENPAVAMDSDGDFVVVWNSYVTPSTEIFAQRYGVVPEVQTAAFHFATAPHKLSFTFDRDVAASLGADDLVVLNLATMQTIPAGDFSVTYDTQSNTATFTYAGVLPEGRYRATLLSAGVSTVQGAALATDRVLQFVFLPGDANNDGRVNLEDFNILAGNFGQSPRDFTQGDFDYSGNVNLNDFNLLAARFGQVLAGAATAASPFGRMRSGETDEDDAAGENTDPSASAAGR